MKYGYTTVRRLKLTPFELRVAIDALNAQRLKQKANGIDNSATSNLILHLLDALVCHWHTIMKARKQGRLLPNKVARVPTKSVGMFVSMN